MTYLTAALILFLEGLASAGLQMITIRQTMPFVGSSVLSTSVIIACFLGALALGYFCGGQQRADRYTNALTRNLVASIALFGIGLSYSFVSFFFTTVAEMTEGVPFAEHLLIHLLLFCLLVMSPLVFCLGQTVPLLLNVPADNIRKSVATGNATALSTIGNVVGCLVTPLLLMYFFGVGAAIFINCLILYVCLIILIKWQYTRQALTTIAATPLLLVSFVLNVEMPAQLFAATTPYSNIYVANDRDGKRLIVNRNSASYIDSNSKKGWPYIELIKQGLFSEVVTGKEILVLGAGGFTLSAESTHGAHFTYLDIDSTIKDIAEKYFLETSINGLFVAEDARSYLINNRKLWDVIVIDLYSNAASIPHHTSTVEFFSLVSERIKPSGRVILNIAANPTLNDSYSQTIDRTIRSGLSGCITDLTKFQNSLVNIVYFCGKKTGDSSDHLYRDDSTEVEVDSYLSAIHVPKWTDNHVSK